MCKTPNLIEASLLETVGRDDVDHAFLVLINTLASSTLASLLVSVSGDAVVTLLLDNELALHLIDNVIDFLHGIRIREQLITFFKQSKSHAAKRDGVRAHSVPVKTSL